MIVTEQVTESGTYQLATTELDLIREVTYTATYERGANEHGEYHEYPQGYLSPLDQATTDAQALADERGESIAIVDPNDGCEPVVAVVEPSEHAKKASK